MLGCALGGAQNGATTMALPLSPDTADLERRFARLPIAIYQAGETVLSAASKTGRLLILKEGAVEVVKDGIEIATIAEPGAIFGDLSALLDQPHTANVRALAASQLHVADADTLLRVDPIALLYVATLLARRLDRANRNLVELKRQVQTRNPHSAIAREFAEQGVGASGGNLVYAGYPYDLFAPGAPTR
jgi:CRP-like cAMP-binding protein